MTVNLEEHLFNFIKHTKTSDDLIKFTASIIVSSLLLDSYLSDAYRKSVFF